MRFFSLFALATMVVSCANIETVLQQSDSERALNQIKSSAVDVVWAHAYADYSVDRFAKLSPVVDGGYVVYADRFGKVQRLDVSTSKLSWSIEFDVSFSAGPVVAGNNILVGASNAELFSLRRDDGVLVWRRTLSSELLAPPQLAQGIIVAQTNDGKLVAVRENDGALVWSFERSVPILTIRGTSAPIVVKDRVIAGFANGKVVAVNLFDGKLLWESSVGIPKGRSELERIVDIDGELVYSDDVVYAVSYQGKLAAMSIDGGRIMWSRDMSSFLGMTIDSSYLYVTDDKRRLWAFDKNSGATLWMQDRLMDKVSTRPIVNGDAIIVGDKNGRIYWLAKTDGSVIRRLKFETVAERGGIMNPAEKASLTSAYRSMAADDDRSVVAVSPIAKEDAILVSYRNGIMSVVRDKSSTVN